jgi:hypothetical protein
MGKSSGWCPTLSVNHGKSDGSGDRWRYDSSRSDASSWKKSGEEGVKVSGRKDGEEDEVTSPLKLGGTDLPIADGRSTAAKNIMDLHVSHVAAVNGTDTD